MKNTSKQEWLAVGDALPENGTWVLHTYAGVRAPEYGLYRDGRFWREAGPESFPATHWLPVPIIGGHKCRNPKCETTMSEGSPDFCPQCQDDREKLKARMDALANTEISGTSPESQRNQQSKP